MANNLNSHARVHPGRKQRGFTLLEVLVSISIFAIIGLGANQMLRTIIDTHDHTKVKIDTMNDLTRAFASLERDFGQAVPRYIRDEFGDPQPALIVAQGPYPVELTRSGWSNPIQLPRSHLQRVAYDVNQDGELVRLFWLVLDRAEDSEPIEQVLLTGVEDLRISLLTSEGETTNIWPDGNYDEVLPRAIEIYLDTEAGGELRKVYHLVDGIDARNVGSNNSGSGNNAQDSGDSDSNDNDSGSSDGPDDGDLP